MENKDSIGAVILLENSFKSGSSLGVSGTADVTALEFIIGSAVDDDKSIVWLAVLHESCEVIGFDAMAVFAGVAEGADVGHVCLCRTIMFSK
jgi:hypothetical protein